MLGCDSQLIAEPVLGEIVICTISAPNRSRELAAVRQLDARKHCFKVALLGCENLSRPSIMHHFITRYIRDDSGATAIEYGLIAALLAVAVITAVTNLGTKLSATFTNIKTKVP